MPRGPKVNKDIERTILEIVSSNPELQASEIELRLRNQFARLGIPIPTLRTIQLRAKRIRDYISIQDKPWSIAAMMQDEKNKIPWEAVEFIMQAYIEIEGMINSGEMTLHKIWRYRSDHINDQIIIKENNVFEIVNEVNPNAPIMTYRQAKWLWRIHLMLPGLKPIDLFGHVDAYVQRELFANYYGAELDTSDLDSAIMNKQRDVMKHGYYPDRGGSDEGTS